VFPLELKLDQQGSKTNLAALENREISSIPDVQG
jgi:hypothetical protein